MEEIPEEIIAEFSEKDVTAVDFSSNSLVSLNCKPLIRKSRALITFRISLGLTHFTSLKEVIFDNNFLSDATMFPKRKFPGVAVLSINNNKVKMKVKG